MKAKVRVSDLVGSLSKLAPFDLAEDWDNVGLLIGDPEEVVTGVAVAVNLGPEVLVAAQKSGANVVVCHHPPIFKPIAKLTKASHPYLYEALRRGYSVVALHTNFDLSSEQMNRELAEKLSFTYRSPLAGRSGLPISKDVNGGPKSPASLRLGKFVTFVPKDALETVRQAMAKAGAGIIGEYSNCSFSCAGEGSFLAGPGANPSKGKKGRLEAVSEQRLEMIFPWKQREKVIKAARGAHPYEEMAFDVIELANGARDAGYGFVADLGKGITQSFTFLKLVESVKRIFKLSSVIVSGPGLENSTQVVRKIAFSPGSGSAFISAAVAQGADVYICGEVGYHQMLEARQKNLTLIVLGHSYSERFFVQTVTEWCREMSIKDLKIKNVINVFEMIHDSV